MTIIAGFKSSEGIVICADTEESSDVSKRQIPKLRFEATPLGVGNDIAVAFGGSSDSGAFVDKITETAWESVQTATSLDEACREIEESIKGSYKEFGRIFQTGKCPSADLIYAVKMFDGSRLFTAQGPIINEKHAYDTAGLGYYLADFICGRMYHQWLNVRQWAILAAYVLFQAKEHVPGCGGDSQIVVLRNKGKSGVVDEKSVRSISNVVQMADRAFGNFLIKTADLNLNEERFRHEVSRMLEMLNDMRTEATIDLRESWKIWDGIEQGLSNQPFRNKDRDILGFQKDGDDSD